MTTVYQRHVERWRGCTACRLHEGRRQVVFARGDVPAHVVLVGEAPGRSENVIGSPFVGPAGHLMDSIVRVALAGLLIDGSAPRAAFCNIVGCFPREEKEAGINAPPASAIKACSPKLREFIEMCRPLLIVAVGALSKKWAPMATEGPGGWQCKWTSVTHPAAILRQPLVQQGMESRRAAVVIRTALDDLLEKADANR